MLRECCRRAGAAVDDLRRAERESLNRGLAGFEGAGRERVYGARRRLGLALPGLEEPAFDPLVPWC